MDEYPWLDGVSEQTIKRERAKARELRKTRWWQQKTSSGRCHYCDGCFAHHQLTMDHRIPLSRGGRSTKDNLVPCCKACNDAKKTLLPAEWQQYLERIDGGEGDLS